MNNYRRSFWKATLLTGFSGVFAIAAGYLAALLIVPAGSGVLKVVVISLAWSLGLLLEVIAIGGLVALRRDADQTAGRPDLFLRLNRSRSELSLAAQAVEGVSPSQQPRRWPPKVGDLVEIRPLEEIQQTLDASGCLDSLPFQAEMAKLCGQRVRVYRGVDKIYDYGRSKTLRRLKDSVLLVRRRCDGSAHDGCQAGCYFIWKTAWLKPLHGSSLDESNSLRPVGLGSKVPKFSPAPAEANSAGCYSCQFTELRAASTPMKTWDFRQDLRPLVSGNITGAAFCIALLTRAFNRFQRLRGGIRFPAMFPGVCTKTPRVSLGLEAGDSVRVLTEKEITSTLDPQGRNRGLWFDAEMLKYSGQTLTVLTKIERIIDDATGRMLDMKLPCIVLNGVEASGEYLRFLAQHDYPYWREAWLSRETSLQAKNSASVQETKA